MHEFCYGNYTLFQVMGGDPLLKLIAVDWFKVDQTIDGIALHPRSLVQVEIRCS
jgi:hypothetical protein